MGNTDQPSQSDDHHSGPVAHEGLYQEASAAYHDIGNFMACAVCSHLLYYQVNFLKVILEVFVCLLILLTERQGAWRRTHDLYDILQARYSSRCVASWRMVHSSLGEQHEYMQEAHMHGRHQDIPPESHGGAGSLHPLSHIATEQLAYSSMYPALHHEDNAHLWPGSPITEAGHLHAMQLHASPLEHHGGSESLAAKITRSFRQPGRAVPQVKWSLSLQSSGCEDVGNASALSFHIKHILHACALLAKLQLQKSHRRYRMLATLLSI